MQGIKHPLSGATYDLVEPNVIEVSNGNSSGLFTKHGVWISGAIRHADPHVCLWVSEPVGVSRHADAAKAVKSSQNIEQLGGKP